MRILQPKYLLAVKSPKMNICKIIFLTQPSPTFDSSLFPNTKLKFQYQLINGSLSFHTWPHNEDLFGDEIEC